MIELILNSIIWFVVIWCAGTIIIWSGGGIISLLYLMCAAILSIPAWFVKKERVVWYYFFPRYGIDWDEVGMQVLWVGMIWPISIGTVLLSKATKVRDHLYKVSSQRQKNKPKRKGTIMHDGGGKSVIKRASEDIKADLDVEVQELEARKASLVDDLEELEVTRLKRQYNRKTAFFNWINTNKVSSFLISHGPISLMYTLIVVSILLVCFSVGIGCHAIFESGAANREYKREMRKIERESKEALKKAEEERIEAERIAEENKPVIHDVGGNLWSTNGMVEAERFEKQLLEFTKNHTILSFDSEKGVLTEESEGWCGCETEIPAIEAWIVVEGNE